jgi:hypothetical protein
MAKMAARVFDLFGEASLSRYGFKALDALILET